MIIHDEDGKAVKAGDRITFSYGIPGVRVEAPIVEIRGELFAMTPGHTPDRCKLKDLRKHVGEFWKMRGAP
ncbi:hypothetical protein [Sinorhizobium sp. GL28]|uniref:hypothetical protein n=1 Tax=Sinorhizobium sp. GL28 TaxID=1358418 RepID=UPI00071E643A|nr:hypothetical protein [Sinorhizobium sp. GL28]KSV95427.1 hypothetical protein N184_00345 [Sinorhizobium sp. GL28]